MTELYDTIGTGYGDLRRPDKRIAFAIHNALGDAQSILNVGAGAGSYEPLGRRVTAVEPSRTMIDQRGRSAGRVVRANGDHLPFESKSFDASLAVLTIHHWPNRQIGVLEMRRVARQRAVIMTWDPDAPKWWLLDYFPEIRAIDRSIFPTIENLRVILGGARVTSVPVPEDCTDGFLGAYWKRPEMYLNPDVRAAMSTFTKLDHAEWGIARLANDLASGRWERLYGDVMNKRELDLGYRLVVAEL